MSTLQRRELISFGAFEVDVASGEIRKAGMRVRLQTQPFRALVALLARPGEIVSREELQVHIWGANTNVDFERGIASAMNKLREALNDSAEHPRYIETLSKRGYRFIAPVSVHSSPEAELPPRSQLAKFSPSLDEPLPDLQPSLASAHLPSSPPLATPLLAERVMQPNARRSQLRSSIVVMGCLAVLTLMGISSLATWMAVHSGRLVRPPRITQLTHSSELYVGPPNPENLVPLVTDGPRIYTSFLIDGRAQIASTDLSGAQLQSVSLPDELSSVSIADISRDGSRLIVRSRHSRDSEQPLWVIPTAGSSALRVGDILAHDATFMPGDRSILYATGNELDIARLDTGGTSKYASLPGRAFWPRWSPDGTLLRFTLIDPGTHASSLWELNAATRHVHQLYFAQLTGLSLCCGSWTADSSLYVFQASNAGENNIWTVGTGLQPQFTELTNGPLQYMAPLPSRADKTIFFVGLQTPTETRFYDQKLQKFVQAPPYLARARRVTYSRDAKWVAWVDIDGRLWRARSADGTGRLQLTPDDLDVFLAQWSPDGAQLVFMARKPGEPWQLDSVDATGGVTRQVLTDPRNLADPDWSADGRQIVFGRESDLMGKESGPHDIEILDLASHTTQALPGSENLFSPRWSPDGRWILALSLDQTRLLLYDVQARSWRTLFLGGAADPVWSLDSKAVYFHAFSVTSSPILRVLVSGGELESVADLSKIGLPAVDSYFFGGVTPAGAPIIEPGIGTGNLFSIHLSK